MLRDHGQSRKYSHDVEGYNGRLDSIQAGFLRIKLRHLTAGNEKRRECARRYQELLGSSDPGIRLPFEPSWAKAVYHLYVIRIQNRDQLQKHLGEAGIGTGIHYPLPLHLQKVYSALGYTRGGFPVSERLASEVLSMPIYPGLTDAQQDRIAQKVVDFVAAESSLGTSDAARTVTLASQGR
jgi:dTDP-4-amino-4,6-dideoxygalactose transaminase